ncbi:MAG: ABC-F family ATP-binding cassette domain-containing protein [Bacteroidetes bacterium]|nr:ABC-F family ATP-binding cassette domain-containing protein [Bacteroidota bacterium]
MLLLQAAEISREYAGKSLFIDLNFSIETGDKIALVAENGKGKTTLLNILAGKDKPDNGIITLRKNLKIGYLQQTPAFPENITIGGYLQHFGNEFAETIAIYEKCLKDCETDYSEPAQKKLEAAEERMHAIGAWNYESSVREMLHVFRLTDFKNAKVSTLSGGQKKRLALICVLLSEPELLLLDEPTNHLDIEMTVWLENFLGNRNTAILLVSHDRYFMNTTCHAYLELDAGRVFRYQGSYTQFIEKRGERIEKERNDAAVARNLLRREEEWYSRQPKARTTKSKARIASYFDLKDASAVEQRQKTEFMSSVPRMGKKILELHQISKSFTELKLLDEFTYTFLRGEKAGIVGKNGSGKTTLLNLITGSLKPDRGEIIAGETIKMAYFKQEEVSFPDEMRVVDVVKELTEDIRLGGQSINPRQFLGRFGFSAEMQYTQAGKLSRGEKRRLYLLTVLLQNPNFLILDEPTNDLDILTIHALEDYLQSFEGCLLVVSHDRYFMDAVAEHLIVFDGDGEVRGFAGSFTQYLASDPKQDAKKSATPEKAKEKPEFKAKEKTRLSYMEAREFEMLTTSIEQLENEKATLEKALHQTNNHEELIEQTARINEIIRLLDEKGDRWLELSEFAN